MLKGARCETAKCAMERQWRCHPPGMHAWRRRRKAGDYGIRLRETARRCKVVPYWAGAGFDHGGITDSVELLFVPEVYVEDLFVIATPDGSTGRLRIEAVVHNAAAQPKKGCVDFTLASARSGETTAAVHLDQEFSAGSTRVAVDAVFPAVFSPADCNDPKPGCQHRGGVLESS